MMCICVNLIELPTLLPEHLVSQQVRLCISFGTSKSSIQAWYLADDMVSA